MDKQMKDTFKNKAIFLVPGLLIFIAICELGLSVFGTHAINYFKESFPDGEDVSYVDFIMAIDTVKIFTTILVPTRAISTILLCLYLVIDYRKNGRS